jgi:glyoxylase-like metal-dependent hydrolase (beta-lactamase superfamily II)
MEERPAITIRRVETAPYGTNAYAITESRTRQSLLVDAPAEAGRILEALDGTFPQAILLTHNHFDHTGALKQLASELQLPVAAHAADAGGLPVRPRVLLEDGATIPLGEKAITVLHTPGHTPGSLCFLVDDILCSGDTLFPGGPGRTATPEDLLRIVDSLKRKIFILPDETRVFPGHGEGTILLAEKEAFAEFSARPIPPGLCGDVLWRSA